MKKIVSEYINKEAKELHKDVEVLREKIAKLSIEQSVKPQKDTNMIYKKKKKLAVLLTVIRQKELGITK